MHGIGIHTVVDPTRPGCTYFPKKAPSVTSSPASRMESYCPPGGEVVLSTPFNTKLDGYDGNGRVLMTRRAATGRFLTHLRARARDVSTYMS